MRVSTSPNVFYQVWHRYGEVRVLVLPNEFNLRYQHVEQNLNSGFRHQILFYMLIAGFPITYQVSIVVLPRVKIGFEIIEIIGNYFSQKANSSEQKV